MFLSNWHWVLRGFIVSGLFGLSRLTGHQDGVLAAWYLASEELYTSYDPLSLQCHLPI